MEVRRLTGTTGAKVIGADVFSDGDWPEISQASIDHAAIVIWA